MGKTNIEWADYVWNPVIGCSIVSPGCTNCYAMKMAARIQRMAAGRGASTHYAGTTREVNGNAVWTGKLAIAPDDIVTAPLHQKKPRKIFVCSMGDLFHENVPDEWIDRVFAVMALAPQHTFQVLTKRSTRMREYFSGALRDSRHRIETITYPMSARFQIAGMRPTWPLPHVWLGVSAEDQARADERVPDLLATPAAIRFVSAEPLLSQIDFTRLRFSTSTERWICNSLDFGNGFFPPKPHQKPLDWIIVGGESGSGARPMHPDWARSIRDQCRASGTPFFMKQMGGPVKARMPPIPDDLMIREFPKGPAHG